MAAFDFPNSPNTNDVHTENGVSFKWDGTVWKRVSGTGAQGATGSTGSQGTAGAQGDNAGLDISTGAPSSPDAGDLWFDSDSGVLAAYYNDGNSSQWVEVSTGPIGAQGAQGNTGATGSTGAQGATAAQGAQGATGSTGAQGATGAGGSTGSSGATGAQGATGSTGSQGATGSTGAQGAEGNFGGATFYYTFEANTTNANPGAGDLRLDNSTQNAATGIYICDTDEDGTDIASYLQTIDDSTSTIKGHVKISNKLDSSQFILFTISSLTDNTGYFDITVSPVDSSATSPFSANEDILITFARTGDKGDTGAQGAAGSSGSAGAQGATGSATISNNANDRVITGGSGTNLNGEANLTFDGSSLTISGTTDQLLNLNSTDNGGTYIGYKRSGTRTAYLGHGGTGSTFSLRNEISDGDVTIAGNDGGSYITMLRFDTPSGGNATFSGNITASGIAGTEPFIFGGFGSVSATQGCRITGGSGSHPACLSLDGGSSPTLEFGSKSGETIIGTNSYGNSPMNFKTGMGIATLSGGTIRMSITSGGNVRVTSGVIENSNTISSNYTVSSNYNAMSAGPMSIANGVSVTVPSGSAWTIV